MRIISKQIRKCILEMETINRTKWEVYTFWCTLSGEIIKQLVVLMLSLEIDNKYI